MSPCSPLLIHRLHRSKLWVSASKCVSAKRVLVMRKVQEDKPNQRSRLPHHEGAPLSAIVDMHGKQAIDSKSFGYFSNCGRAAGNKKIGTDVYQIMWWRTRAFVSHCTRFEDLRSLLFGVHGKICARLDRVEVIQKSRSLWTNVGDWCRYTGCATELYK